MTAQPSDGVDYQGKEYSLANVNGDGLFDLNVHGIHPVSPGSLCWRGYWCEYIVADATLILSKVFLWCFSPEDESLAREGKGPMLFGQPPETHYTEYRDDTGKVFKQHDWGFTYRPATIVPFTGSMLIGADFIRDLYVHMGFHPAWKFREVHELAFQSGRLVAAYDRSEDMQQFREDRLKRPLEPPAGATEEELAKWIDDCFSLGFKP